MKKGRKNSITDVAGITVGHQTIKNEEFQTGVTAIFPHQGQLFKEKLAAAVHVANGFGKSVGLLQVEELGMLETPILLTNTFAVGTAMNALFRYSINRNKEIGDSAGTVNPLVFECNDGEINNIRGMAITEKDVEIAMQSAKSDFEEGAVGAGTGMRCYQLKGGIGSASRILTFNGKEYTLGCLVLTNYGQLKDLELAGYPIGVDIAEYYKKSAVKEKGSVITILATDIPLSSRQLKRISKRATVGITKTGAFVGSDSGEITLAFSTHQKVPSSSDAVSSYQILNEEHIDELFRAVTDMVNEAVLHSLIKSRATTTKNGQIVHNLQQCLQELQKITLDKKYQEVLDYLQYY
ncbi:P1 family peptidase [Tetragenococcus solitarius]|uniref:P1 family peptidase n=1 Tax=Tetragenococcus solitarius TaxID=71453 RepID=A0ABP6KM47_9ENTE|nr:P1 family peptidase [Tetragenococcus solitarius]